MLYALVLFKESINDLFCKIFPYESANSSSNFHSKSASFIFNPSSSSSNLVFHFSSSGSSKLIVIDNNWPSNPDFVTVKLIGFTKEAAFGGISINESQVEKKSLNYSL